LPQWHNVVLTIGTFDGVHQGHKSILQSVVQEAKAIDGTSILITFDPHPRKLIFPNESLKLLSTLEERWALVGEAGIDVTVVVPFTQQFAAQSAQDYIQDFLLRLFEPQLIVIGYDHHFGHDRTGDIHMLARYAADHHFEVKEISAQLIADAAVSSTQVRKALLAGAVDVAAAMLGKPYHINGKVVQGAQRGRTIGYPTANIQLPDADKLIPQMGVYAVQVYMNQLHYKGMLNLGVNPTVSDTQDLKIEVHIFDFAQEVYGAEMDIYFVARIRDEMKFTSLDELKMQLALDKENAIALLA
jgi:riboflavin kinase/FMN adenylyltransferase